LWWVQLAYGYEQTIVCFMRDDCPETLV
jgi:hypothetical protein